MWGAIGLCVYDVRVFELTPLNYDDSARWLMMLGDALVFFFLSTDACAREF